MKPFLQSVAEDIQQRFGDDLSDIAIIFNNKRPITYLNKHLADLYGRPLWSPQFFTIQEFLKLSSHAEPASQLTQFFYLFELHNKLLQQEGADPETLEEFYPIAEIILSDFGQLDYDLVPVNEIYMELYDTSRIDVEFQHLTAEQQHFIRQFWQSFSISGHSGIQQRFLRLWKRLPLLYKMHKEKLRSEQKTNFPTIYRDLVEGRADNPDFARPFKKLLFVGFNALSKAEETLFKHWQDEGLALFYFDADSYYLEDKLQEAGLFIRRNIQQTGLINALGDSPNLIGNRTDKVHLYAAMGRTSQTKLLHDILLQNEQNGQTSAILLADESLLVPLLQSMPTKDVNITTGFPLLQSPLYGLLDLWLKVQEEISHFHKKNIHFEYLESFLHHPLTKTSAEDRKAIETGLIEKPILEIPLDEIQIPSAVLPHFFRPVVADELIPTMLDQLDLLLQSLTQDQQIRLIDANLLIETKKVLNQLSGGLSKMPSLPVLFQIGLIRKVLAPINAAIKGDPLKGIQVMGLLESRCLNFDHIYILGANEGVLPKTSNAATFLPNNLRKAYGLPVLENQDALSAYLFYRHFQYSQEIHIFYNSLVNEHSTGEESRFVRQLEFESQFHFIRHNHQQPITFPAKQEELIIPKTGEVWDKMYEMFIVQKRKLSATAFTSYLQSPLQFFLRYVAEIKEQPAISQEFEMNRLGTVVHQVMEKIFQPYQGKNEFTSTKALRDSLHKVDRLVVEEIGQQYHSTFQSVEDLNSLQRIMHEIASEYIRLFLQYDMDNYTAFKIIELENDEDYTLDFPIDIQGKTETIRLFGIIDRIDEVLTADGEVKTRIVDYKTGSDSVVFKNIEKIFAPNSENKALLQTLFYTYVYEQVTQRRHLEPHLYVARRMREEGTIFGKKGLMFEGEYLSAQKLVFVDFLRSTLEEIFNPEIPFRHHPDMQVYDSDPYKLFYQYAKAAEDDIAEE